MSRVKLFGPVKVGCNAARVMAIGPPLHYFSSMLLGLLHCRSTYYQLDG